MYYNINMQWDPEAAVWIAESDDVPGLVLESGSFDALVERVRFAVPELLELNNCRVDNRDLMFRTERLEKVHAYG